MTPIPITSVKQLPSPFFEPRYGESEAAFIARAASLGATVYRLGGMLRAAVVQEEQHNDEQH